MRTIGIIALIWLATPPTARSASFAFQYIDFPGAYFSTAMGINNAGQIVGSSSEGSYLLSDGGFVPVNVPGAVYERVAGINNRGQIAGTTIVNGELQGFVDTGGVFTFIKVPGGRNLNLEGLNDLSWTVGLYDDVSDHSHGFLETNGQYTTIDYPGAVSTFLSAINNAGDIVGAAALGGGFGQGFLYSNGTFVNLNYPGALSTFFTGINNSGEMIGLASFGSGSALPFVYADGIFAIIPSPVPGAYDLIPRDIDDYGRIAGEFTDAQNTTHGFIATPVPEPGTLSSFACGILLVCVLRRDFWPNSERRKYRLVPFYTVLYASRRWPAPDNKMDLPEAIGDASSASCACIAVNRKLSGFR